MTREQFEKLLYDFSNAAAESWRKDTIKEYNNSRSEIIAEFDRLNADIERLENPWREPDEFPEQDCVVLVDIGFGSCVLYIFRKDWTVCHPKETVRWMIVPGLEVNDTHA